MRAQYTLGIMYSNGQGVIQDDQQAAFWYHKAAEQGHAEAQFNLGLMYHNGQGVTQDDQQAASWYRKAGQQGDTRALEQLKGLGISNKEQIDRAAWERLNEFTLSWKEPE
ncbi:MAG: sel1 repeat family protein [Nitrosomonadales bacterium]|nr:sel1 repeat family protein [Nitrosomonadales bacterium]